jgi:hypothetical protein
MLDMAYEEQISEPITNLYVELVRVRREIADALGDENYLAFAYEENGFEYTTREMKNLLCNIKNYVAPVYWDSSFYSAYSLKMQSVDHTRPFREEMINQLYNTYQLTDRELGDIRTESGTPLTCERGAEGYTLHLARLDIHEIVILPYAE